MTDLIIRLTPDNIVYNSILIKKKACFYEVDLRENGLEF